MSRTYTNYQALNESAREIRLLTLLPPSGASEDDQQRISCSLETTGLANANPFYALSYVWGAEDACQEIVVDGQAVRVRSSLAAFLRELRRLFCRQAAAPAEEPRTMKVWADSVCINQSDLHERSSQVSIMGDIFREANAVCAWLGEPSEPVRTAFQHLAEVAHMRSQNQRWMDIADQSSFNHVDIKSIGSCSYWTRMWIKQEVILARDVSFYCGPHVVNWADLRFATNMCPESSQGTPKRRFSSGVSVRPPVNLPGLAMTALLDLRAAAPSDFSLSELLEKFRDAECLDTRDRIYACLSLLDSDTRESIAIDYSIPVFQVLLSTYTYWSGEHFSAGRREPVIEHHMFCSQMAEILPAEELSLLANSEEIRSRCNTTKTFAASAPVEILEVVVLTCAGGPGADGTANGHADGGVVMRLTIDSPGRSERVQHRERFVYASMIPEAGDSMVHIGSRICFLRSGHHETAASLPIVVGSATEMLHPVNSQIRVHSKTASVPCNRCQNRLQLPDAIFELVPDDGQDGGGFLLLSRLLRRRVLVSCNTAAIITLLLDSGKFGDLEGGSLNANSVRRGDWRSAVPASSAANLCSSLQSAPKGLALCAAR